MLYYTKTVTLSFLHFYSPTAIQEPHDLKNVNYLFGPIFPGDDEEARRYRVAPTRDSVSLVNRVLGRVAIRGIPVVHFALVL